MKMLRPWGLNIAIERTANTAIYLQIAQKIIVEIQQGRCPAGMALPGSRELAVKLNVNRKTIIQAYDELIAQGWLTAESKRGTFIATKFPTPHKNQKQPTASATLSAQNITTTPFFHEHICFDEGVPDSRLLPTDVLTRSVRRALTILTKQSKHNHADPQGSLELRQSILQMLNMEKGLHAHIEQICITRDGQMSLYLLANTLLKAKDYIVMEQLSHPLVRDTFESCGAKVLSVMHDNEGLHTDHLEQLCTQHKIRAVYVTPQQQMPTTVCMSPKRRKKLLSLAQQYDFLIIEDNTSESDPLGKYVPPIAEANAPQVIYIGSLEKTLPAEFCVSYIVAPIEIIQQCSKRMQRMEYQNNSITRLVITDLLLSGEIKRHLLRTHKIYAERKAFISILLHKELNEFVNFQLHQNHLAIWLEINPNIDMARLLSDAKDAKVNIIPGSFFSRNNSPITAIRLGFAHLNNSEISLGIQRLKSVFLNQKIQALRA